MKILSAMLIVGMITASASVYAETKQQFSTIEDAQKYLVEKQKRYDLNGFIGNKNATIVEFSSQGCLTKYLQIGSSVSYSGHKIDLRQEVVIDWSKARKLNKGFTNDSSSGLRIIAIGNVFYTQYVKLVRGWNPQENGSVVVFSFNSDLDDKSVLKTIEAMNFIQSKCSKQA
ncbi:hypothetical protein [Acinetobacter sp. WCHAc010052]|jgi:hypothetical protein|uniref:hypothetical protein n=1 Tax=Acinetobacter sp. WCHAc010052 TaxID=2004647 RepID=UPI000B3D1E72|nr:hypothetical protein [Acinetobacter sp. WCHAc010052]AXY60039.1 hypothetical protein CDG61_08370 [Acinetobacter sp. WCHAc010052]